MIDRSDNANRGTRARWSSVWDQAGMLIVLLVIFVGCAIFVPYFLTVRNLIGLSLAIATVGMISCTMLLCLASGNFDLSVGSVVACGGVVAALTVNASHSVIVALLAAIGLGVGVGLVNGVVVAKGRINPLITTLATMMMVRGLAQIITGGTTIGITQESFYTIGGSGFLLPTPVWIRV